MEFHDAIRFTRVINKPRRIVGDIAIQCKFLRYFKEILSRVLFNLRGSCRLSFVFNDACPLGDKTLGKKTTTAARALYTQ